MVHEVLHHATSHAAHRSSQVDSSPLYETALGHEPRIPSMESTTASTNAALSRPTCLLPWTVDSAWLQQSQIVRCSLIGRTRTPELDRSLDLPWKRCMIWATLRGMWASPMSWCHKDIHPQPQQMDLPRLVVDRILLHLTDVDALYSVHMAREALKTVIDMCPGEWRPELHAEFLCRVKPPPRQDPGFCQKNSTRYLVPQSVAGKIANKHKGKRVSRLRLTAMRRWLLEQHGSAMAWKAAQIATLSKKSRCVWTAESLTEAMPSVVHLLAKNLDVPESFLRRLQIFDEPMQIALLDGEATPAATKRLLDFMLSTDFPGKDECILLQRHVLSGDKTAEQECLDLATGKLAALSEDAAGMKELLKELSPDRADVITKFAKEIGTYLIVRDLQDAIVGYIKGAETWNGQEQSRPSP